MSLSETEILTLFKNNLLEFIDNLVELCPNESELVVYRILLENSVPIEVAITQFGKVIIPLKEMIDKKDEKFFLENHNIFGSAKNNDVIKWKRVWTESNLDASDKESIWKWLSLFLKITQMYFKQKNNQV